MEPQRASSGSRRLERVGRAASLLFLTIISKSSSAAAAGKWCRKRLVHAAAAHLLPISAVLLLYSRYRIQLESGWWLLAVGCVVVCLENKLWTQASCILSYDRRNLRFGSMNLALSPSDRNLWLTGG